MKARKHVVVVGTTAAEMAEIAVLVRATQAELDHAWTLGADDDNVDFVLVDLTDFGGRCARVRAMDEGKPFAVLANQGEDVLDADLVLYRPLEAKAIIGLLNHVGNAGPVARRNLVDFASRCEPLATIALPTQPAPQRNPDPATDDAAPTRATFLDGRERACTDLDALLKRGAVLIERAGLHALLLDPVTDTFHTAARLAELEPYFLDVVAGGECKRIGGSALAAFRKAVPGRPLARLRWLHALLRSNGWLAAHLDPGANYRLRSWLPLEADYRKQHRIATTLLREAPLHTIAASANARMADVFNVVNAYDAVGLIEATRQPLAPGADEPGESGRRGARARGLLAAVAFSR